MAKKSIKKPELKVQQISHPNSRKAKQLVKKTKQVIKRNKSKIQHQMKVNQTGERMMYFKEHLNPETDKCSQEELANLIEKYLGRFNEELEQIQIKHSVGKRGRQHASREDAIKTTMAQESDDYNNCGLELPDLFSEFQVKMLKEWNGELRFIQNFKFRRFSKLSLLSQHCNA